MIELPVSEALTFDDVLLVPAYSDVVPAHVSTQTRLTQHHHPQHAADVRRHGHRDRVAPGHRHGAAGRHGRGPSQSHHRAAVHRDRQGQAVGVRHDHGPGHHRAGRAHRRRARHDAPLQDLRRARHQGPQTRRHPYQPRPALRHRHRSAHQQRDDERESHHRARGHHARTGREDPASASRGETARRQRRLRAQGPDHRQGHPEEAEVSARGEGRAGTPARRRRHRRDG